MSNNKIEVDEKEYFEFMRWKERKDEIIIQDKLDKAYTLGLKSANLFLKFIKKFELKIPSSYKDNEEYDSFLDGFSSELNNGLIIVDNIKIKRIKWNTKNASKKSS